MRLRALALAAALAAPLGGAAASGKHKHKHGHKAHVHGKAKLGVVVDGASARIELDAPAEALYGFEHAPKTDAQKKKVADAERTLKEDAAKLFRFAADKGCTAGEATLDSKQDGDHADVKAAWTFTCQAPLEGSKLTLGLAEAFPRMKTIELALLSGAKQTGRTLKAKDTVLDL